MIILLTEIVKMFAWQIKYAVMFVVMVYRFKLITGKKSIHRATEEGPNPREKMSLSRL